YILTNTILALLEYPEATLLGVNRMLSDKEYRKRVVENISDPAIKSFWTDEFAKYNERYMQEAGDAIKNKVGQFTANPVIRNVIGQPHSSFDIRKLMDEKKILIMNLSKGRIGEQNSNLLGSMLVTKIYLAAMSRADVLSQEMAALPDFYFYVDEFQSFANESFADILSEARKYKLNLTIAHQYVEQMPEEVRAAVFGNIGTMAIFRIGSYDAEIFEKEFAPEFTSEDIVNLGFAQIYIKLMIDGIGSKPFSAQTLPPIEEPPQSFKDKIIENTRQGYARPRSLVEEEIKKWHEPIEHPKPVYHGEHGKGHQKEESREEKRQQERREESPRRPFTTSQHSPQTQPRHNTQSKVPDRVTERIPLAHLTHKKDKGPSAGNKLVLKEALEKALAGRGATAPSADGTHVPQSSPSAKEEKPVVQDAGRKEVSEEELKKILE
ncbi:MAG: type IV secretory system conjugative DNA transfer family protein, partial [Patescibacteria group bacterium]